MEHQQQNTRKTHQRNSGGGGGGGGSLNRIKTSASVKARSLMNLHNNEAGRRVSNINDH